MKQAFEHESKMTLLCDTYVSSAHLSHPHPLHKHTLRKHLSEQILEQNPTSLEGNAENKAILSVLT